MFEAATNHQIFVNLEKVKPRSVKKSAKGKVDTKVSLASVINTVSEWRPISLNPTRKELTQNLLGHLSSRGIKAKRGCIPTLLVQGKYPIEILAYSDEEDVFELLGRMLWIHDEYGSVIGVLSGIEEEEYAEDIQRSCEGIFLDEKKFSLIFV